MILWLLSFQFREGGGEREASTPSRVLCPARASQSALPASPAEVSPAHHVLLGGVLMALQDPDPVLVAQAFNLLHRLVPKFLYRHRNRLSPQLTGSKWPETLLHVYIPYISIYIHIYPIYIHISQAHCLPSRQGPGRMGRGSCTS